mgnify:CR=1 FL=1
MPEALGRLVLICARLPGGGVQANGVTLAVDVAEEVHVGGPEPGGRGPALDLLVDGLVRTFGGPGGLA